jgi:hypothetical protein
MDSFIPKFNVASQWVSSSGVFAVQLVELSDSPVEMLLGGTFAIRVCLMNQGQKETVAFTINRTTAQDSAITSAWPSRAMTTSAGKHPSERTCRPR